MVNPAREFVCGQDYLPKKQWTAIAWIIAIGCLFLTVPAEGQSLAAKPAIHASTDAPDLAMFRQSRVYKRNAAALDRVVDVRLTDVSRERALDHIANLGGFSISYSRDVVSMSERVTILMKGVTVLEAIWEAIRDSGLQLRMTYSGQIMILNQPAPETSIGPPAAPAALRLGIIQGQVTDAATGEELPGVNVVIVGTTRGSAADIDGRYSIVGVEAGTYSLRASLIGFRTKLVEGVVVPSDGAVVVDIALEEDALGLDEVVVVGYGEQSRTRITGAVASVRGDKLENQPVASLDNIFQGQAAGVHVVQNSGAPGSSVTVRIRGNNTVGAGNQPLYVVDGVPVTSGDFSELTGGGGVNALADINPNNIQSVEVLKDASAAAIYGARASNGVVLITTKSGRAGKPQISVNLYRGSQDITKRIQLATAREQREYQIFQMDHGGTQRVWYTDSLNAYFNSDFDWQSEIYRPAPISNVDLSLRGGTQDLNYSISLGYFDQDGIIRNSAYNRLSSQMKVNFQATDKLSVGSNILYGRGHASGTQHGPGYQGTILRTIKAFSFMAPYDPYDGSLVPRDNPVAMVELPTRDAFNDRVIGNLFVQYEPVKNLRLRSSLSTDRIWMKEESFRPMFINRSGTSEGEARQFQNISWISENTLNYKHLFARRHDVDALLGASFQEDRSEEIFAEVQDYATENIRTLNAGATKLNAMTFNTNWAIVSYFGRLNYSYRDRYLLSFTARRDGSSRFGKDRRWGLFPSVAIGWRASEEKWFAKNPFVNDLKLRASVGQTGNQSIGNFVAQGLYSVGQNYMGSPGVSISSSGIPNNNLSWESTTQMNAGVDVFLLQHRIKLIADYYVKRTNDLLFRIDLPSTSGFNSIVTNLGEIENKGLEFDLTTFNLTGDFEWTTSLNMNFNRNKVISLPNGEDVISSQQGMEGRLSEGQPMGNFYGFEFLGVYPTDEDVPAGLRNETENGPLFTGGNSIFRDVNGDNIINDDDRVLLGNALPDYTGGFSNTFGYKGLELRAFFTFSYGNEIFNRARYDQVSWGAWHPLLADAVNYWRQPGDQADYPLPIFRDPTGSTRGSSSMWIEDGSYLRLKNVSLAYNLPGRLTSRLGISNLQVYGIGQNLYTWTKYSYYDPEAVSSADANSILFGIDAFRFPMSRSFTLGIKMGI